MRAQELIRLLAEFEAFLEAHRDDPEVPLLAILKDLRADVPHEFMCRTPTRQWVYQRMTRQIEALQTETSGRQSGDSNSPLGAVTGGSTGRGIDGRADQGLDTLQNSVRKEGTEEGPNPTHIIETVLGARETETRPEKSRGKKAHFRGR